MFLAMSMNMTMVVILPMLVIMAMLMSKPCRPKPTSGEAVAGRIGAMEIPATTCWEDSSGIIQAWAPGMRWKAGSVAYVKVMARDDSSGGSRASLLDPCHVSNLGCVHAGIAL